MWKTLGLDLVMFDRCNVITVQSSSHPKLSYHRFLPELFRSAGCCPATRTQCYPGVISRAAALLTMSDEDQNSNVFIQKQSEFLRKGSQRYQKWISEEAAGKEILRSGTVSVAITVQSAFHNTTIVLQGFLSGFCAAQAFLSVLYRQNSTEFDLSVVSPYIQSVLFVCFTLSSIAAFDRFETGSTLLENVKRAALMQQGGLAVCVWLLGSVFNLVATSYEQTVFSSEAESADSSVHVWRYLCIARACAAGLGWLLVALRPNHNHLRQQLMNIKDKY
uniref:Transmembrane protein n=1 Tax=Steinernema glaseri TaxID=37863 RepID=A0A1I7Z338_9BILA